MKKLFLILLLWAPLSQASEVEVTKQLECLARAIYFEAKSEPFEGKVAVAQVTINRTIHPLFPNTICDVIREKTRVNSRTICQYSWYCRTHSITNFDLYRESRVVARMVLFGEFSFEKYDQAIFFHSTSVRPGWKYRRVGVVGNHVFYKHRVPVPHEETDG